jgi:hypothetical protein
MARRARRTTMVRVEEVVPRLRQIMTDGEHAFPELFAS